MNYKILSYSKQGNRTHGACFVCLLVVFLKSVLFNWICFSEIQENYLSSLIMSLPQKLVPALFIAEFVFVSKRQRWTIVVNAVIDIWIVANLFYFKANGIFLSWEIMTMARNVNVFLDSLLSLIGWNLVLFSIITIAYAVIVWKAEAKEWSY